MKVRSFTADKQGEVTDMELFLLWHVHELKDDYGIHEEVKFIGVFSSEEKAREAIGRLKILEGFKDYPSSCFQIDKTKADRTDWNDGFCTVRWTE